jgi:hypothetical protein
MFDKYFELTLGESEMSNAFFETIIESQDYDFIKQEVLKNDNDGKSEDFLEKLKDNAHKIDSKNIKLFFRLLYDIGDNLNIKTGDPIFTKNSLLLQNIGVLSKLLEETELYEAMDYAIKNAEDCLHLLVDDLAIHDQLNQRYRFKNEKSEGKPELTNDQLDELEKQACIKIKKWADDGKIFDVYRSLDVIYEWYYWDNVEYNEFINKTIQDDEKIIKLIEIFGQKRSDGYKNKFNFKIMEKICPIKEIYNQIKLVVDKLDENSEEKLLCQSFIEEYEKR